MNNFLVCVNAVTPIFLLLAMGFGAKCAGLINRADVARFNKIAFKTFMPVLLFHTVYTSDLSSALRPKLMLYAMLGITAAVLFGLLLAHLFAKETIQKGVMCQGIFRSNFVIIGIPIAESLVPNADLGCVALLLAVVVPYFNILAVVVLSVYNGTKPELKKTILNILKNPLILGSLVGMIAVALKIQLPTPVLTAVRQVSQAASPLMLFLLGAFFEFEGLRRSLRQLVITVAGRLVLVPAVALTGAYFLGFRGIELAALMGVFASSAAVNSFTMAQQMGGDEELAGNVVVITSALCPLTLFLWGFLFKSLGAF